MYSANRLSWREYILRVLQETSRKRVVSSLPANGHCFSIPEITIFIMDFSQIWDFFSSFRHYFSQLGDSQEKYQTDH